MPPASALDDTSALPAVRRSLAEVVAAAQHQQPLEPLFTPGVVYPAGAELAALKTYIAQHQSAESRRVLSRTADRLAKLGGYADAESAPWPALDALGLATLRNTLFDGKVPQSTINLLLSVAKGIARAAYLSRTLSTDAWSAIREVRSVSGTQSERRGRALPIAEVHALMTHCSQDDGPVGRRDAALLALAFGCGLRRAELAGLTVEGSLLKKCALVVKGKGNKQRTVPIPRRAAALLQAWFDVRPAGTGPVFVRFEPGRSARSGRAALRNDERQLQGLSTTRIYQIVRARAASAGLDDTSPHDLRRSFATYLLDVGAQLNVVADLLGHADVNTTRIYDRGQQKAAQRAIDLMDF